MFLKSALTQVSDGQSVEKGSMSYNYGCLMSSLAFLNEFSSELLVTISIFWNIFCFSTREGCWRCSWRRARSTTTPPWRSLVVRSRKKWSKDPRILTTPSSMTYQFLGDSRSQSLSWSSSTWSAWGLSTLTSPELSLLSLRSAMLSSQPSLV